MNIIVSIEAEEGGVSTGEIPAILRNASGTPTSWGAAQVIGNTAVGTLEDAANSQDANISAFPAFYGLGAARLAALVARATATVGFFTQIRDAVVANTTEAALQAQITAFIAANAANVRRDTGLGPSDIEQMFRAAQLRRHLLDVGVGGNEADLFDRQSGLAVQPAAADNLERMRLSQSDVGTYLRNPSFFGEHREGFVTRSLFFASEGQVIRNALTDDTGFKIGRFVIRDNWETTDNLNLTARERAQVTAYLHNHGGVAANLANQLNVVAADGYVTDVMVHFDAQP